MPSTIPRKHELRKSYYLPCPVCGADERKPCVEIDEAPDTPETQLEWAEFAFMAALHNLKEIKPDHYLVLVVEVALQKAIDLGNESDEAKTGQDHLPSMLRNQAD